MVGTLPNVSCLLCCRGVMAEGNGGGDPGSQIDGERTEDYQKLINYGLNEKVAAKLDEIYKQGKLRHEVSEHLLSITCCISEFKEKLDTYFQWFCYWAHKRHNPFTVGLHCGNLFHGHGGALLDLPHLSLQH